MKVVKIALCGKARAGKDTVADHLFFHYGFYKIAFADKMKKVAHEVFFDVPYSPKPRRLYQDFGEYCRKIDPLVWVKHVEDTIATWEQYSEQVKHDSFHIVVTDMRNEIEANWARENGYTVIKIEADYEVRADRALRTGQAFTPEAMAHSSEQAVDNIGYDYIVYNNDTFEHLFEQIDAIMNDLGVE